MTKFTSFAGKCYYPSGGMDDYLKDHETLEDAKNCIIKYCIWLREEEFEDDTWGQIWNRETEEIINYKYENGKLAEIKAFNFNGTENK